MLDRIIKFSLENPLFISVAAILLMVSGIIALNNLDVDVFPDLNAPTVVVMTEAPGMAPEEVERLISFPIETAVNGASCVRRVRSTSSTGFSVVWVEFEWGTDIYKSRQIVSERLMEVSESLPPTAGKPVMGPQSSILGEMMMVALTSDTTSMEDLRTLADWTLRPRILSLGGVAQVSVQGGDVKEYQIRLLPGRMQYYGVTLEDVLKATADMNRNVSGGVLYEYGNEYIVVGRQHTTDMGALGRTVVRSGVTLDQVAEISEGVKSPKTGVASLCGHPAVVLTVTKQPQVSTIDLTRRVDEALRELQPSLPTDVHVATDVFRQERFIDSSIRNITEALIEGGIFVVLILFVFLMNGRTTLISLVSIPMSLIVTVLTLKAMGLTINTMSIGGMAIAIGSLVDDAIVDVENVYKRLQERSKRLKDTPEVIGDRASIRETVFRASREVRLPILNSTLIIVVSFVPLFFLSGMEGRMLRPLGVAFIVSLFASTLVALTLTPLLCSLLLGKRGRPLVKGTPWLTGFFRKRYGQALTWTIEHGKWVIGSMALLLVVALVTFFSLGHSFLPAFNEGSFTINVSTWPGISLEESDRLGRQAEELLLSVPEISTVARKTGRAELDEHSFGVNVSEIEAPFELSDRSKGEVMTDIRTKLQTLPGVNVEIGQPISHRLDAMLSGTASSIAVKIFGNDLNRLYATASRVREVMKDVPGVVDLNMEQQVERPQLLIVPRREMLVRYGVTPSEFASMVEVCLSGKVVSQVFEGNEVFDLTVKVDPQKVSSMDDIRHLPLDAGVAKVPLEELAEIRSVTGPNTISRENVSRRIVVSCNVEGNDLQGTVDCIRQQINEKVDLPDGFYVTYGGQFESAQSASRTLRLASLVSILIIFLLLYAQFKSVKQSAIVLVNLPLALIGGVFAIFLTDRVVSIPSIIGFISLFGIATRNGMLLIERYNDLINKGVSLKQAVVEGSLDRLNPILMTALTSALALIPIAVGGNLPGNEIQCPMARVILGGLLTSTLLNGFILPIIFLFLSSENHPRPQ